MRLKQTHAPGPPVFLRGAFSYERGTPVLQETLNLRTAQQADFGDLMFFRTATDRELLTASCCWTNTASSPGQ